MGLITQIKILIGKFALNESRPTKEKSKNARLQANQAKSILKVSRKKDLKITKKAVVKKN